MKDHGMLNLLLKEYGSVLHLLALVDVFFDCLRDDPKYRKAPPTISCMVFNRNDLMPKTVQALLPKKEKDYNEF